MPFVIKPFFILYNSNTVLGTIFENKCRKHFDGTVNWGQCRNHNNKANVGPTITLLKS